MEAMIDLNATALTRLTYAAAPGFVARGAGTIINIASVVGISPETINGVYGATKAFVLALSHSLQHELGDKGIRIQAVLPGATATDLWETAGLHYRNLPAAIVMSAEDMVDAALIGLDQNERVTIPPLHDGEDRTPLHVERHIVLHQLRAVSKRELVHLEYWIAGMLTHRLIAQTRWRTGRTAPQRAAAQLAGSAETRWPSAGTADWQAAGCADRAAVRASTPAAHSAADTPPAGRAR